MYLIFDFDGTLVDSFRCVMEKAILLAEEFDLRKLEQDEINHLRDLTSKEVVKYLQIPIYKIPKMIYQIRKHLRSEMKTLKPIEHIPSVLQTLNDAGLSLGILTSNSAENVSIWLKHNHLEHYFKFIQVESNYFSKKFVLRKTIKNYRLDNSETFYICDETRDIDAAKKNGVKSIAVTWGYNSEKALLKYEPTFIAHQPQDILSICGLINK